MHVQELMTFYSDIPKFMKQCGGIENVLYGVKEDGYRVEVQIDLEAMTVKFLSRSRKEFPNFGRFIPDFLRLAHCVARRFALPAKFSFDAEVVGKDGGKSDEVTTQVRRTKDIDDSIFRFRVFDLIDEFATCRKRYQMLEWLFDREHAKDISLLKHYRLPKSFATNTEAQLHALRDLAVERGLEGFVLKNAQATYQQRRTHDVCKLVANESFDLEVVGVEEGAGKLAGMVGRFVCMFRGQRIYVGPGKATQEMLKEFFSNPPRLIEVNAKEVTKAGQMRHGRFIRVRDDKTEVNERSAA